MNKQHQNHTIHITDELLFQQPKLLSSMKKTILILIALLLASAVSAQKHEKTSCRYAAV